jgi:hypothetical protein
VECLQLHAEQDETQPGCVYAITLRVRDASRNVMRKDFEVTVPINQSGAPAVQDATAFMVTSMWSVSSP